MVRVLRAGNHWRKHAPVQILALVAEYCERLDEQVVVLFQVLAAEINFGYKFQTVGLLPPSGVSALPAVGLSFGRDFTRGEGGGGTPSPACFVCNRAINLGMQLLQQEDSEQGWRLLK